MAVRTSRIGGNVGRLPLMCVTVGIVWVMARLLMLMLMMMWLSSSRRAHISRRCRRTATGRMSWPSLASEAFLVEPDVRAHLIFATCTDTRRPQFTPVPTPTTIPARPRVTPITRASPAVIPTSRRVVLARAGIVHIRRLNRSGTATRPSPYTCTSTGRGDD